MEENIFQQRTDLRSLEQSVETLKEEIGKVIVGQEQMVELLLKLFYDKPFFRTQIFLQWF